MSDIKKLQKAFELLLNEEDEAADKLMHEYLVGVARNINEQLEDAELDEADFDMEDDLEDEIQTNKLRKAGDEIDYEEFGEEDDDFGGEDDEDFDMDDEDAMGDLEGDDLDGDGETDEIEGQIADIHAALDELQAEFDALKDTEEEEHDMDFDVDDDDDFDMEDDDDDFDMEDDDDDFDMEDDDDDFEESLDLEEDEDLDEEDDLDEDDDLEESVELTKVSPPSNTEGQEVGKGPSFQTNTQSLTKPKGDLEKGNAKPVMSKGGEASGYKEINKQVKSKPKDMNNPDNTVSSAKSSQSKVPEEGKGDKEVGKGGKSVSRNDKALIGKKVR